MRFFLIGGGSSSSFKSSSTKYAADTAEGITVAIVKGKLAEQRVDVIVNTTSKDLDLDSGAVSKSLLQAAGTQIKVLDAVVVVITVHVYPYGHMQTLVGRSKFPSAIHRLIALEH